MNSKKTVTARIADQDSVRSSRDGDQFHYHWAARHCLELLPGLSDLAAISIEGASAAEGAGSVDEGDELIDVAFYYGSEALKDARLIRYVQLKHSTKRVDIPWTASGLGKTLKGFSKLFAGLRKEFAWDVLKEKLRFSFTTNRPIDQKVSETLEDLARGASPRHLSVDETLRSYVDLSDADKLGFFQLFSVEAGQPDLWNQRNLLFGDVSTYLAEADSDAPVQLKELVAKKATSEYASNPSIRQIDVLRALKTDEADLFPAKCLIKAPTDVLRREQEPEIRATLEGAAHPVVLHADGGVGKSILALQLSKTVPSGSVAVLYDCFGDGLYRSALHYRHRHKDAFPQIANELAAQGLCDPLIPLAGVDGKQFMRALVRRLQQAVELLRAKDPAAALYLIVDAADNAVMAADEFGDAAFVADLIRTPLPAGVKLTFTCRTHRRSLLDAPPDARQIPLRPFSKAETARHLLQSYPEAIDSEVEEFAFLSSANPRVQALALSRKLPLREMFKELGPEPSTVERAIGELLQHAVDKLKYRDGQVEAGQVDLICQGLAVLRPLVPIPVLAQVSGTTESAVRSFAFDLGRPLLVKGNSLHFLDEPSETWFRERFQPDHANLVAFLDRLRPLSASSSYVASTLPQLLLAAGHMDELVSLALSKDGLPASNPLERRDVEVQRLTFALKACLQSKRYASAAKLALKVAGELAGVARQNKLIQDNTDIASVLLSADRVDELVSRRTFGGSWTGAHHAYDAGLLAGHDEFISEARSRLRMAIEWLYAWARMPHEERERERERVGESDIAEIAMAKLLTEGAESTAKFLRGWSPRSLSMDAGRLLARRLVDLARYDLLDQLATEGAKDVWLMLGLACEACDGGHALPPTPIERLMRTLGRRRIRLGEPDRGTSKWDVLDGITSAVRQALRVLPRDDAAWAKVLRRYLPDHPPRELAERFASDRTVPLRAYTLEAALLGKEIALIDLAPQDVRVELEKSLHSRSSEAEAFDRSTGGVFRWFCLSAQIACGTTPTDFHAAADAALQATSSAKSKDYQNRFHLDQTAAVEWARALRDASIFSGASLDAFREWLDKKADSLWPATMASVCRIAARAEDLEGLALEVSVKAFEALEELREHADSRVESYQSLARAIFPVSKTEAETYFDQAVEVSSRIGSENADRWSALLSLAQASGDSSSSRPKSAYRLARGAELTFAYVDDHKHFNWRHTVDAMLGLCSPSALAILSRWRDRGFGDSEQLLETAVYGLVKRGSLPEIAPVALSAIGDEWNRSEDIARAVQGQSDEHQRRKILEVGYRYLRVSSPSKEDLQRISESMRGSSFVPLDFDRLLAAASEPKSEKSSESWRPAGAAVAQARRDPDWNVVFGGVDLSSSLELRKAYALVRTFDPPYQTGDFYREGLRRCGLGGAADFCRAVAQWPDVSNFVIEYLLDALAEQKVKPLSLRKALGEVVLASCRSRPEWASRRRWGSSLPYKRLIAENIVSDAEIVDATLEGFLPKVTTLGAEELFQLLEPLAFLLTNDEADDALHFGLGLLEEDLRPDDGDGPWSEDLSPPGTCEEGLAGYVWAALGAPSAALRWQTAHAVRASIELGWTAMLAALAERASLGSAGAFVDKRLVFYEWHSRQWLLIALARCAADGPGGVRPFGQFLLAAAKEEHILLRHFAAQALSVLPEIVGEWKSLGDVARINASVLPVVEHTSYRRPAKEPEVPDGSKAAEEDKYYFGIDIGPYWFEHLGRIFGVSEKGITQRAIHVIRERMSYLSGKAGDDLRYKTGVFRHEDTRHSHGSMPRVDDLRAYHAYHAMMIVGARLLKTHSVGKAHYSDENDFDEWLEHRLLTRDDGKWAADRRDAKLTKAPPPPTSYGDKDWCWSVSAQHLDSLMYTDEGLQVVAGDWASGPYDAGENISVTSALVPKATAAAFLAAAQTAASVQDIYFRFDDDDEEDDGDGDRSGELVKADQFKLRRWVAERPETYGVDEYDPWGERLRFPGDIPNALTIKAMALEAFDDGRRWVTKTGATLRSETWTQVSGMGQEREMIPGTRLSADTAFLQELLEAVPGHQLIVSLSLRRQRPRHNSDEDGSNSYPDPYVRYYLIEEDGIARTLKRSH